MRSPAAAWLAPTAAGRLWRPMFRPTHTPVPPHLLPCAACMAAAGNTGVGALLGQLKEAGQPEPAADMDAPMDAGCAWRWPGASVGMGRRKCAGSGSMQRTDGCLHCQLQGLRRQARGGGLGRCSHHRGRGGHQAPPHRRGGGHGGGGAAAGARLGPGTCGSCHVRTGMARCLHLQMASGCASTPRACNTCCRLSTPRPAQELSQMEAAMLEGGLSGEGPPLVRALQRSSAFKARCWWLARVHAVLECDVRDARPTLQTCRLNQCALLRCTPSRRAATASRKQARAPPLLRGPRRWQRAPPRWPPLPARRQQTP